MRSHSTLVVATWTLSLDERVQIAAGDESAGLCCKHL